MPNWISQSKKSPDYRFIVIRELLQQVLLRGMEGPLDLPFAPIELVDKGWYTVSGAVTNRDLPGGGLIWWYRQRCGNSKKAHRVPRENN